MIKNPVRFSILISALSICMLDSQSKADRITIPDENIFCPHSLSSKAKLVYDSDKEEFTAFLDGNKKKIRKHNISGIPSNLSENQLEKFLKIGYFSFPLQKIDDEIILKAKVRGKGGMKRSNYPGAEREKAYIATGGMVSGAISGAAVGGPIGSAVGAVVGGAGAWIGAEIADRTSNNSNDRNNKGK